ncbi:MAG: hypothetical protein HY659_09420 [Rhizobiales bacterium]|nr:hypothetical protein [Hyphomicrobiales bacterium]
MIEAEAPFLAFAQSPFRSAVRSGMFATRPFARRVLGAKAAIIGRLDPDAIE